MISVASFVALSLSTQTPDVVDHFLLTGGAPAISIVLEASNPIAGQGIDTPCAWFYNQLALGAGGGGVGSADASFTRSDWGYATAAHGPNRYRMSKIDAIRALLLGCETVDNGLFQKYEGKILFSLRYYADGIAAPTVNCCVTDPSTLKSAVIGKNFLQAGANLPGAEAAAFRDLQNYFKNAEYTASNFVCGGANLLLFSANGETCSSPSGSSIYEGCTGPTTRNATCNAENAKDWKLVTSQLETWLPWTTALYTRTQLNCPDVPTSDDKNVRTWIVTDTTGVVDPIVKALRKHSVEGGGTYYGAPSADILLANASTFTQYFESVDFESLRNGFDRVFGQITVQSNSSFAPAATQSADLYSGNWVYVASFQPNPQGVWFGNVRKHCVEPSIGTTVGVDAGLYVTTCSGEPTPCYSECILKPLGTNSTDGKVLVTNTDPRDFFSNTLASENPNQTQVGISVPVTDGAAFKLRTQQETNDNAPGTLWSRSILTWTNGVAGYTAVNPTNWPSTSAGFGAGEANAAANHMDLMSLLHGYTPNNGSAPTATRLAPMAEPFNGTPILLNYDDTVGCTGNGSQLANRDLCCQTAGECWVVVPTNDGELRFIDAGQTGTNFGKETTALIPAELWAHASATTPLKNLKNQPASDVRHRYYLDGGMVLFHDDRNGNSRIDNSESAYLIFGLGRGGRAYYLIDVSTFNGTLSPTANKVFPLAATIPTAGEPVTAYTELRETWRAPWVGRMKVKNGTGSAIKNVAIFASGHIHDFDADGTPAPAQVFTKTEVTNTSETSYACLSAGVPRVPEPAACARWDPLTVPSCSTTTSQVASCAACTGSNSPTCNPSPNCPGASSNLAGSCAQTTCSASTCLDNAGTCGPSGNIAGACIDATAPCDAPHACTTNLPCPKTSNIAGACVDAQLPCAASQTCGDSNCAGGSTNLLGKKGEAGVTCPGGTTIQASTGHNGSSADCNTPVNLAANTLCNSTCTGVGKTCANNEVLPAVTKKDCATQCTGGNARSCDATNATCQADCVAGANLCNIGGNNKFGQVSTNTLGTLKTGDNAVDACGWGMCDQACYFDGISICNNNYNKYGCKECRRGCIQKTRTDDTQPPKNEWSGAPTAGPEKECNWNQCANYGIWSMDTNPPQSGNHGNSATQAAWCARNLCMFDYFKPTQACYFTNQVIWDNNESSYGDPCRNGVINCANNTTNQAPCKAEFDCACACRADCGVCHVYNPTCTSCFHDCVGNCTHSCTACTHTCTTCTHKCCTYTCTDCPVPGAGGYAGYDPTITSGPTAANTRLNWVFDLGPDATGFRLKFKRVGSNTTLLIALNDTLVLSHSGSPATHTLNGSVAGAVGSPDSTFLYFPSQSTVYPARGSFTMDWTTTHAGRTPGFPGWELVEIIVQNTVKTTTWSASQPNPTVYILDLDVWAGKANATPSNALHSAFTRLTSNDSMLIARFTRDCSEGYGATCFEKDSPNTTNVISGAAALKDMACPISGVSVWVGSEDTAQSLYWGDECGQIWTATQGTDWAWTVRRLLALNPSTGSTPQAFDNLGSPVAEANSLRKIMRRLDLVVSAKSSSYPAVFFGTGNEQRVDELVEKQAGPGKNRIEMIGAIWDDGALTNQMQTNLVNLTNDPAPAFATTNPGWYILLPQNQRMLRDPIVIDRVANFRTWQAAARTAGANCTYSGGGDAQVYAMDYLDASATPATAQTLSGRTVSSGSQAVGSNFIVVTRPGTAPIVTSADTSVSKAATATRKQIRERPAIFNWRGSRR